jgi:hypothetical protein
LPHREIIEPLQGKVSLAAHRAFKRLKKMLKTPRARMTFIQVLADLFQLNVDCDGGVDSVRLSIPPPLDENDLASCGVPNVLEIGADGTPKPVNYELKESEGVEESPLQCSIGYAVLTLACNLWQDADTLIVGQKAAENQKSSPSATTLRGQHFLLPTVSDRCNPPQNPLQRRDYRE